MEDRKKYKILGFKKISGLLNAVNRHCHGNNWMFRGVASLDSHLLIPTIGRLTLASLIGTNEDDSQKEKTFRSI